VEVVVDDTERSLLFTPLDRRKFLTVVNEMERSVSSITSNVFLPVIDNTKNGKDCSLGNKRLLQLPLFFGKQDPLLMQRILLNSPTQKPFQHNLFNNVTKFKLSDARGYIRSFESHQKFDISIICTFRVRRIHKNYHAVKQYHTKYEHRKMMYNTFCYIFDILGIQHNMIFNAIVVLHPNITL